MLSRGGAFDRLQAPTRPKAQRMSTLKLLGAGPVKRGVTRLAAEFEKRSGHKVSIEFAGAPAVSASQRGGSLARR